MKKTEKYEAPKMEVLHVEIENAILAASGSTGSGTGSEDLNDSIWI